MYVCVLHRYGGTCNPTCISGYGPSPRRGRPTAVCTRAGTWEYGGGCEPGPACIPLPIWRPQVTGAPNDAGTTWVTGFGGEVKWAVNRNYKLQKIPPRFQSMAYLQVHAFPVAPLALGIV